MKIDIDELKMYLCDPYFPNPDAKSKPFVVLNDMKSPTTLNAGKAFIATTKVIPSEWSTKDLAKYIKINYSSFAFYNYEYNIELFDKNGDLVDDKIGKIRFGAPKLKVEVMSEYVD